MEEIYTQPTEEDFTDLFGVCFNSGVDAWYYFLKKRRPWIFKDVEQSLHYTTAYCFIDKDKNTYKEIERRNNYIYQFQEAHQNINNFMKKGDMDKELNLNFCCCFDVLIIPEGIKHLKANYIEINDLPTCLPDSLLTLDLSHSDIKNISVLPPNLQSLKIYYVRSLTYISAEMSNELVVYSYASSYEKEQKRMQKQIEDVLTRQYYENNSFSQFLRVGQ